MATRRVFSEKFLARLKKPLTEADVRPQFVYNEEKQKGYWRPPQVSLRIQNDLRKACIQEGIDPLSIGLPPLPPKKPLRTKPNKLEKHERLREQRQETIRKNLEKMPEMIQAWKEVKMRPDFSVWMCKDWLVYRRKWRKTWSKSHRCHSKKSMYIIYALPYRTVHSVLSAFLRYRWSNTTATMLHNVHNIPITSSTIWCRLEVVRNIRNRGGSHLHHLVKGGGYTTWTGLIITYVLSVHVPLLASTTLSSPVPSSYCKPVP